VHEFVTRDHGLCYLLGEPFSQRSIGWLSTRVVVSSRSVEEHFSPPIRREKMCLVYYGIAGFDASPNRADLPALRVLLLGRQTPTKGQKLALEAAGILGPGPARIDLRLVGSITPAYREELQRIASALGISDRVEIVDASSTPENELAWANVVLMCSDHEASGRVTVEALKSGRPVVGTRTGGTPELISDGVNGFLFAPGSAQELAAALRRVASEPGLLERLSEGARASVEDRFTIEAEVDDFVDVLEAAVARGNRLRSPRRRGRLAP
jgi:glycosyltransferase involved in cell wall biosynthesis